MDLDDNGKLFGELFGFQGKKSTPTPVISPSRPGANTIHEDSSNLDEDSDDDFALPPTPAKKPIVVDGEGTASGGGAESAEKARRRSMQT